MSATPANTPAPAPDGGASPTLLRSALGSVVAAAFLVTLKLVAGLVSGSLGLVAEAVHSGTDLVAALLTFLALRVAIRPPDRDHPYGHGKAEHLAALGEGGFLVLASAFIGIQAIGRLVEGGDHQVDANVWTFGVLAVVLVVDITRMTVSRRAAVRHGSPALASNALHFASDMVGTIAVLIGLLLTRAGTPAADSVAALVVAVLVVTAAVRLMRRNVDVLMDATPEEAQATARAAIVAAEPTVELRRLRVRAAAGRNFVEATIAVPPDAALGEGHAVADSIEEAVRHALPGSDVVVHVEPGTAGADVRERASAAALTVRGVREVHNVRTTSVDGHLELSLHLKLPAGLDLGAAHEIACAVEEAIHAAVPEVVDVHTHIEPLATGAAGAEPTRREVAEEEAVVRAVVEDLTGAPAENLRFRAGDDGLVVLLTVRLEGAQTLDQAHDVASELERRIRERAPTIDEVIVHTEPAQAAGPAHPRAGA
ncbi:MAG TPA: cation diffusion facilitator family transporter [Baekduia sp.]|uniref:cation diffusion facilitator family transporter n=1 Tax=Baekduia sp. TaxID=2600305 RepID=UPI002D78BFC4|nr:cation diffusion facilitator family transporter [Baekduia sp.]HET6507691.1 cation diffusion facilitator family transporter [Baekduia sp.]